MKQKMMALFLGICLICTACAGADKQGDKIETPENQKEERISEGIVPNITYADYSQELKEEDTGTLLLAVEENCPVVTVEGNEEAERLINRAFEQQHGKNEIKIQSYLDTAESDFYSLEEEEIQNWEGYHYSYMYETMYNSGKILSLKAVQKQEMGEEDTEQEVVAYSFYVPEGKLLTLYDVFSDESAARTIVEQYIRETVTSEPYEKYLLEDYESYVSDILTEDDFYLDEQGLVIICNTSLLTEEEAGVIEISVPYEALKDVINEQYLP